MIMQHVEVDYSIIFALVAILIVCIGYLLYIDFNISLVIASALTALMAVYLIIEKKLKNKS